MNTVPIMRPKLPCVARVTPYLRKIDASRIYSNLGPLARAFEDRLAAHFELPHGTVATVANATLGLALALTVQDAPPGTLCAMPAWTFVASAHAARLAGLVPYFVDVDPRTWVTDPGRIADEISRAPAEVGAVMPVVPFGQPIDVEAWDRFRSTSGLAVVIDAAAGFDSLVVTTTPTVVSLHATKVVGIGEGGFVASRDPALVRGLEIRANFGFDGTRDAVAPSINAKLSEYHAAVGLAALDEWTETRAEWLAVAHAYRRALAGTDRASVQEGFGERWVTSTCVVRLAGGGIERAEATLSAAGIDSRRWWGPGAHAHAATMACPRTPVPVTEALARSTIGVPLYRDMDLRDVVRAAECLVGG